MPIDNKSLDRHVEDILKAINNKERREVIERELRKYIEFDYSISIRDAKRSIVMRYGGDPNRLEIGIEKKINELKADDTGVDLVAKILSVASKTVTRDGNEQTIYYGLLADDTGSIPYTVWQPRFDYKRDDVIKIRNATVKGRNGRLQLNIGERTRIELEPESELVTVVAATTIKPVRAEQLREYKLKELKDNLHNITLTGRIIELVRQERMIKDVARVIYKGVLADEEDKIRFTAWEDFGLNVGDVIKVENCYTRSWRGIVEVNIDGRSKVEKLSGEVLPSIAELESRTGGIISIGELPSEVGKFGVNVEGVILEVREGSGLIYRCSDCNRPLHNNLCSIHGDRALSKIPDLRVKAVLDDGTGAITLILNKAQTESLLNKTVDECVEYLRQHNLDSTYYKKELEKILTAKPMRIKGTVTSGDYGPTLMADSAKLVEYDIKAEARQLLTDLEVSPDAIPEE